MSKPRLFAFLLLALGVGFALSHYAAGQSPSASNGAGDVAMQRLERLTLDLTARGDTNTLIQVASLLAAKDVLTQTRDASTAVALLQRLRTGRTNEAIELLEINLDGALTVLGEYPKEIGDTQTRTLELARQYRAKYPRTQDAGVNQAFGLLDKR